MLEPHEIPKEVSGEYMENLEYWYSEDRKNDLIGGGFTPDSALKDLYRVTNN